MKIHKPLAPAAFSEWLDMFRWIAAAIVVVSHAGGILMLPLSYLNPAERPPVQYAYSFVAGFAHYAVIIFFVMSGYLVGGSWISAREAGRASFKDYISKRLARLTVVLYPVLLLTPVLFLVGTFIYPGETGTGVYPQQSVISAGPATLICNMAFLQDVACRVAGDNLSLWSLTHEFWYYIAFPMMFMGWPGRLLAVVLLGMLSWFQFVNVPILPYFGIWLLGAVVAVAPHRILNLALTGGLLALVMLAGRIFVKDAEALAGFFADFCVALLFAALLVGLKGRVDLSAPPLRGIHTVLAGFSYTLYCTHVPLLYLFSSISMATLGIGDRSPATGLFHWLMVFAGIAFSFLAAFAISKVTEAKTDQFRQFLTRLGSRKLASGMQA